MKKLLLVAVALVFMVAVFSAVGQVEEKKMPAPPPARQIPAINAPDRFPGACVDCHINYVDMKMDTRFSTLMAQWQKEVDPKLLAKAQAAAPEGMKLKGKHPAATEAMKDIPKGCLVCHAKGSKMAPPFAVMLHEVHLTGGDENHFMTIFQGECTHCHKLNLASGQWTIPSGPEK